MVVFLFSILVDRNRCEHCYYAISGSMIYNETGETVNIYSFIHWYFA